MQGCARVAVEVILRDFDGSETVFPAELPLKMIIHTGQIDLGILIGKTYRKTEERDRRGRVIYVEQR